MLARRFRLKAAMSASERTPSGKTVALTIPAGGVVNVNSDQGRDGLVWATWNQRVLKVSPQDLTEHGEEIRMLAMRIG